MKKVFLVFSIVVSLVAGVAMAAEQGAADGAALYKARCAGCHGADGARAPSEGVTPLKGQNEAEVYKKLTGYKDGTYGGARKAAMVGLLKALDDNQLKALAKHVGEM